MNNLVDLSANQLALVRRTIAKDCNDDEFSLFMASAKAYGLDPFRKQIMPLVFNKGNADKRQMSIITGRDGLRVIASRCGDYRPASEKAEVESDDGLKSETNPKGLISITVRLWKQDNRGEWFPVIGEAMWDEFAPLVDVWAENRQTGRREPTGKKTLDKKGNWARMPVVMLQKCAEGQALRAGWPEHFAGLYDEAEMDRAVAQDLTAAEAVAAQQEINRQNAINAGKSILVTFQNGVLERVDRGQFADRVLEHIQSLPPVEVHAWRIQNQEPLREFWAMEPNDALAIKEEIEKREASVGVAAE